MIWVPVERIYTDNLPRIAINKRQPRTVSSHHSIISSGRTGSIRPAIKKATQVAFFDKSVLDDQN